MKSAKFPLSTQFSKLDLKSLLLLDISHHSRHNGHWRCRILSDVSAVGATFIKIGGEDHKYTLRVCWGVTAWSSRHDDLGLRSGDGGGGVQPELPELD